MNIVQEKDQIPYNCIHCYTVICRKFNDHKKDKNSRHCEN